MQNGFTSSNAQALRAFADVLEPVEALEADFKSSCDDLSAHVQKVNTRIMIDRSKYGQKVRALDEEREALKKEIQEVEERAAHFRRIGMNGGHFPTPSIKRQEARISELESERGNLQDVMNEVKTTPEEAREYSRLYGIAKSKEKKAAEAAAAMLPALEAAYSTIRERVHIKAPLYGILPQTLFAYPELLSQVSRGFTALNMGL